MIKILFGLKLFIYLQRAFGPSSVDVGWRREAICSGSDGDMKRGCLYRCREFCHYSTLTFVQAVGERITVSGDMEAQSQTGVLPQAISGDRLVLRGSVGIRFALSWHSTAETRFRGSRADVPGGCRHCRRMTADPGRAPDAPPPSAWRHLEQITKCAHSLRRTARALPSTNAKPAQVSPAPQYSSQRPFIHLMRSAMQTSAPIDSQAVKPAAGIPDGTAPGRCLTRNTHHAPRSTGANDRFPATAA